MEGLRHEFEAVKHNEMLRNQFVESLLQRIIDLEKENAVLKCDASQPVSSSGRFLDHDRGEATISNLGSDIMDILRDMFQQSLPSSSQVQELDSTPFVVCLVDGRQHTLLDDHVSKGGMGGKQAAERIYVHLMQLLIVQKVFKNNWRLIIKFYANMSQLGTRYLKAGVIDNIDTWRRFIDGFNNAYQFCYFVDLGDDEANGDEKIQNQLEWLFGHNNCRHTVLVGSGERAYTGFMRQYFKSDQLCGFVTMIEAIPYPGKYHEMASRFLPQEKDCLFGHRGTASMMPPTPPTTCGSINSTDIPETPTPEPTQSPPDTTSSKISDPVVVQRSILLPVQTPGKGKPVLVSPTSVKLPQQIKRKPFAATQARAPAVKMHKPKSAFNSSGQRIDSRSYVSVFAERYLDY